ncbi:MAG: maleylpyruvate isomerase family mycothiol-dependent enzyme [Dehalococcoidia bacterium]
MTSPTDTRSLARAERCDLADLLATLTTEQWEAPSLCAGWRVRDVVAHMFSYEDLSMAAVLGRLVRSGFNADRVNAAGVAAYADHTPEELVVRVRAHLDPSGLTATFGGRIALTDGLIHHQDILRPLGLHRAIPDERMVTVLEFAQTARPIGAARRTQGLTLRATDLDWTTGTGPVVEGPSEPLLLAMAGRRGVVRELSGPGRHTLAERLSLETGP